MTSLKDMLVEAYNKPDPKPYLFEVGQKVKVCQKVLKDGQTPRFWLVGLVTVVSRSTSGLHKEHWYHLEHPNGAHDEFRETELDYRYRKRR